MLMITQREYEVLIVDLSWVHVMNHDILCSKLFMVWIKHILQQNQSCIKESKSNSQRRNLGIMVFTEKRKRLMGKREWGNSFGYR